MPKDATESPTGLASSYGLKDQGLRNLAGEFWNQSVPVLYEHAIRNGEGRLGAGGSFVALTGAFTGRTPKDKYTVDEPSTAKDIDWNAINQKMPEATFDSLHRRVQTWYQGQRLYVHDLRAGADPAFGLKVRVVTPSAWHALFARNMFIRPKQEELGGFTPDFTILHAPKLFAMHEVDGIRSDTVIAVNFAKRLVLILGTEYAGEIKKSVFGYLNYVLPGRGVLPMHCSANVGPKGDAAIFFGLSGTGKTTLSADSSRTLIGDDEHGWSQKGLFNFEGGCYAKCINLSKQAEPEIYDTVFRFGTVLENVVIDPASRLPDLDDGSLTENTRACYPVDFIPNMSETGIAPHPDNVIMLTADAFGVLPPISRLTPEQAMYHFLSGYTARVAGTEKGLGKEPQATFSTCFGAVFMPRHPSVYAKMLGERIQQHKATCWLVNTGWSGGAYGVGNRMKIAHTRALIRAVLEGTLKAAPVQPDPIFGLHVPESCGELTAAVLNPRNSWNDKRAYDETAKKLTHSFEKNFKQYEPYVGPSVKAAGIHAAA